MITVVQLRVLRQMVDTNVMVGCSGEAFFTESSGDVRKQTMVALEKKGLVEAVGTAWPGFECYSITDAGREAVGVNTPSLARRVRKELVFAISIMDESGKLNAEGNSRMLWEREWDTVRQCLFDAIELLEEGTNARGIDCRIAGCTQTL